MKLYKLFLLSCIPIMINAQNLKEIINISLQNNLNIKSLQNKVLSQEKLFDSSKNIYNPTLIGGVNYSKLDLDKRNTQIGATSSLFFKFSSTLYDGGKNEALKKIKQYEFASEKYNINIAKKELVLQIITIFYQGKILEENIKALEEKGATLKAELQRVKSKYAIGMVSYDNVLKLQSEDELNRYNIQELKYQKDTILQNLSLISGAKINSLDSLPLKDLDNLKLNKSENIKAIEEKIKIFKENIKAVSALKKPKIKLEDTISRYNYDDYNEKILKDLPQNQNQFLITMTYNLFDTSSKEKKQSAVFIKKSAIDQLQYLKKKEKIDFELSKQKLIVQKTKIKSAKSALNLATSVFEIIEKKYQNKIVDNIIYLDALSKKTIAKTTYEQALYEYEIAKANHYFKSGNNYEQMFDELIQ